MKLVTHRRWVGIGAEGVGGSDTPPCVPLGIVLISEDCQCLFKK